MKTIFNLVAILVTIFIVAVCFVWGRSIYSGHVRALGGVPLPDMAESITDRMERQTKKVSARSSSETPNQTIERFRLEARQVATDYVSNKVVGFRRIRFVAPDTTSDQVTNWTGIAAVEYINRIGGVEVADLNFGFYLGRTGKILYAGENIEMQMDAIRGKFWQAFGPRERPVGGWPKIPGEDSAQ